MKHINKTTAITAALLCPLAVFAESGDFIGEWVNVDTETRHITRFTVTPSGNNANLMDIQVYGKCHPSDCDWGISELHLYGENISDSDYQFAKTTYDQSFKENTITMELRDDNRLMVDSFSRFYNGSRENYHKYDIFRKVEDQTSGCEQPDLVVSNIERPEYDNGSIIHATIKNIGGSTAAESIARLIDPSTPQETGAPYNSVANVPPLAAGDSYRVTFSLPYWIYNPDAEFNITADYKGMVKECREKNNNKEFFELG